MAVQSAAKDKPSHGSMSSIRKLSKNPKVAFAFALLLIDALLVALIIAYVPYTKIDWDAYMSQVSGFLEGERDYGNLKELHANIFKSFMSAQILFGILYVLNLGIVLFIYVKTDVHYSGAVSVKMNVLLYAPSLLLLMLKAMDVAGVFSALAGAAMVQVLVLTFMFLCRNGAGAGAGSYIHVSVY
ncbi:asparagine-linked glycosylation 3 [Actinidia rufa]|uniref:dolichyl-P-Man:Man5GlcNAc2-PP-dolichol alpha-1,3-mannosyltransferase n=1 Tax=Actinidia rufa TaxID=165716 RepID=A0A7J0H8K7_9ERIC|nr:asparagine-linked glycosylation 3 [Actinidia rufa]